ncbi:MAG TPA: helix-turn-helix transcriptional regulator [Polyangia bacterium]|nr:helix-turn-helix transcriptional regulator [Polyangia bacterium]
MPQKPEPPPRTRKQTRDPRDTIKTKLTDDAPTALDGPKLHQLDAPPFEDAADEDTDRESIGDDFGEEPTRHRGSHPPKPSSSRRLSPTLMKIFQRRREQIGLTIAQVAKLAGIEEDELMRFEGTGGAHRLNYDHAVILARVLGVRPQDMPGLRGREAKDDVAPHIQELERALLAGPQLVFEGKSGERFGGDLERIATTPAFAVRVGDGSLGDAWPKGTLLGFVAEARPQIGDVVLLRHRTSRLLAMRKFAPPSYVGLQTWQPSYVCTGGEWIAVGRLQVILPRTG